MAVSPGAARVALLVVVLMQTAAAARAGAPDFVCWPIKPGETVSAVALRLTGDPAGKRHTSFQILDPATRAFVSKRRYGTLDPRWRACVARDFSYRAVSGPSVPASDSRSHDDIAFAARIGFAVFLILLSWSVLDHYVEKTRPVPVMARRAGEAFLAAFAGPLSRPFSTNPPIRSRLRFMRARDQLEILIAPDEGTRYPNLSDHRANVEYDVGRVLQAFGTSLVLNDRLRAEGEWVVIPVRLNTVKEAGDK